MAHETYPEALQTMIERAKGLSKDEANQLGELWQFDENVILPTPSFAMNAVGELDYPMVSNEALLDAWNHALDAAGNAGRVDVIDAAREAGRDAKNPAEEAVRSAVLAVGVRDLISEDDFTTLVNPWQKVLGAL